MNSTSQYGTGERNVKRAMDKNMMLHEIDVKSIAFHGSWKYSIPSFFSCPNSSEAKQHIKKMAPKV